jgi:hypothetical protein
MSTMINSGAPAVIRKRQFFSLVVVSGCLIAAMLLNTTDGGEESAPASLAGAPVWGTYWKPFVAKSLWISRPVAPVFGDFVIPKADYSPALAEGKFSTGAFLSRANDGPMTVTALPGKKGLYDADSRNCFATSRSRIGLPT